VSFILDALRKSEHERQRSTVPGLSHVPLATPRHALPGWAIAVMGVLAGTVLALGGAWWQSQRSLPAPPAGPPPLAATPSLPTPAASAATTTAAAPPPPPPVTAAVAASAPVPQTTPPPAPAAAATLQPPAPALAAAVEQKRESLASAATAGLASPRVTPSGPTLPSAAALNAQGIGVPPLTLELHAYSNSPSERFVFINGRKYREGERLAEGPEVVAIEPDGVVLSQQGQRFMLAPE
jgi:general secretion pathway protein B